MILTRNPWSLAGDLAQFSAQRSDLWKVSLRSVVQLISEAPGVVPDDEYISMAARAASLDLADIYAVAVTLPEESMALVSTIRGTGPVAQPGYDEPRGPARIQFRHDTGKNPGVGGSEIYCLLSCWQALSEAGQFRSSRLNLPLATESSRPAFKADIGLDFLCGSDDGEDLSAAASYVLRESWCSDVQISSLGTESGIVLVTATINVGSLESNLPTNLSTSWYSNVA